MNKCGAIIVLLTISISVPATVSSMYHYGTRKLIQSSSEGALERLKPLMHMSYPGRCQNLFNHSVISGGLVNRDWYGTEPILAALLNGVGHVCADPDHEAMDDYGVIDYPAIGAHTLRNSGFGPKVYWIVHYSVHAKLLLLRLNPDYYDQLSERSQRSLEWQTERISEHEVERFKTDEYCSLALFVRQAIDRAHTHSIETFPSLEEYIALVRRHFTEQMKSKYSIIIPE